MFDLITARHPDLSSIGYIFCRKALAGSAVWSYCNTRCRCFLLKSRYRKAKELMGAPHGFTTI
eukprot:8198879-Pyramimonas_sp.AAC.1